jgi:hypothetical protein
MPHCQTGSDTRVKNAIHCNSTHSLHGTWACCHTRMSPPSNSFFNAVSGGDLTAVRQLLRDDATRVTQTSNGRTALHLAARNGFSSICSELASFGADLDAIDKEGYGPLHRACRHGHVEVCQVLSELGANVALDPAQQLTIPSRVALKSSRRAQVGTPLHVAAKNNRIQICELLVVTLKAPVNAATINGETPLHKVRSRHTNAQCDPRLRLCYIRTWTNTYNHTWAHEPGCCTGKLANLQTAYPTRCHHPQRHNHNIAFHSASQKCGSGIRGHVPLARTCFPRRRVAA